MRKKPSLRVINVVGQCHLEIAHAGTNNYRRGAEIGSDISYIAKREIYFNLFL